MHWQVAAIGALLGAEAGVTLCYRRPRNLPTWPYNLFTMVHGRDRAAVLKSIVLFIPYWLTRAGLSQLGRPAARRP